MLNQREARQIITNALHSAALVAASLMFSGCSGSFAGSSRQPQSSRPPPVAHRFGAREVAQLDNSRDALMRAIRDDLPWLETDIRLSSDGVPFLIHDGKLHATTYTLPTDKSTQKVEDLSSTQLKVACLRDSPLECILPLSDAAALLSTSSQMVIFDFKGERGSEAVRATLPLLTTYKLQDRTFFLCDPINECVGDIPYSRMIVRAYSESDFETMIALRPRILQIDEELLTPPRRDKAHALGILLLVKTLDQLGDTPEHWDALKEKGVDLILSDYPRAMRTSSH